MAVFKTMLKLTTWLCLRGIFCILRGISWKITGVSKMLAEIADSSCETAKTVHVRKVLCKFNIDPALMAGSENMFLTMHESFQEPRYVLKQNVTLYYVTEKEAVFIETDPEKDVLNSDNVGFLKIAQFNLAKKFIVMPIHSFHALAGSLVCPSTKKLIFVNHTGRCGSTLFCQVMEETPGCLAVSVPDAINSIVLLSKTLHEVELARLTRSILKVICKPVDRPIHTYFIKLSATTMALMPILHKHYPDAKYGFMYRDPLSHTKSFLRMFQCQPLHAIIHFSSHFSVTVRDYFIRFMGYGFDFPEENTAESYVTALIWASSVKAYIDFRKQGMPIVAFKFEDILKDTVFAFKQIYRHLEMDYNERAITTAFNRDSQRNTQINREIMSGKSVGVTDDEILMQLEKACVDVGLPKVQVRGFIAPETITLK